MNNIKYLNKQKILIHLSSTFLFTWILWIISFTSSNSSLSSIFRIAGSLMPSIIALIWTNYFYERKGLKELLKI